MSLADKLAGLSIKKCLVIGVVVGGAYYLGPYDDGSEEVRLTRRANENLVQAQAELNSINRVLKQAQTYRETAEELGEQLEAALRYLPEKLTPADLMKLLSTEAKAAGANIVRVQDGGTQSGSEEDFYKQIVVETELEGSFAQMMLFLSYLTRIDRIISLKTLTMSSKDSGASTGEKQVKFTGLFVGYKYRGDNPNK